MYPEHKIRHRAPPPLELPPKEKPRKTENDKGKAENCK
jgi:hypothetical protein